MKSQRVPYRPLSVEQERRKRTSTMSEEMRYEEADAVSGIQIEVSSYIEALTGEMRDMARAAGLGTLGYFLEMARLEAVAQAAARTPSPDKRS